MVLSCLTPKPGPILGAVRGTFLAGGQPGWLSFLSTVFWGVVAAVPTAGDPKRCPSVVRGAWCVWGPFQKPPSAAGAVLPVPVCHSGPELGEEKGEAAGSWWVVVCFN